MQCRNWDGGEQERDTAVEAVRSVFPDAKITPRCSDKYPIKVTVEAHIGATKLKIWTGRQQDLFRKYASKRSQSIAAIVSALEEMKEDLS